MSIWTTQTTCQGTPDDVLELLTEPGAIARWSPVPFTLVGSDRDRLSAGDRVRVRGQLAGRGVECLVDVAQAHDGHLALTATGPIRIDVDYRVVGDADGSSVRARIGVAGSGLFGPALAAPGAAR